MWITITMLWNMLLPFSGSESCSVVFSGREKRRSRSGLCLLMSTLWTSVGLEPHVERHSCRDRTDAQVLFYCFAEAGMICVCVCANWKVFFWGGGGANPMHWILENFCNPVLTKIQIVVSTSRCMAHKRNQLHPFITSDISRSVSKVTGYVLHRERFVAVKDIFTVAPRPHLTPAASWPVCATAPCTTRTAETEIETNFFSQIQQLNKLSLQRCA
jgi:hypothetical protein